jgi:3-oxoacyl-[acyl-carrier protein] reductase
VENKLDGKVAIVTGGARGLGRAIALLFAHEGAQVAVVAAHQETAEKTANEIKLLRGKAIAIQADVSDSAQVSTMVDSTVNAFGRIDILVNNAGVFASVPSELMTEEQFDRIVDTDLKGVFLCAQAVARVMIKQGAGKILNISSILGIEGAPERAAYCASKAGVIMLTKAFAVDWAKHGIYVNGIAPGYVKTEQIAERIREGAFSEEKLANRTLLGRMADPSDIAKVALFLVSEDANYVTGQTLAVDGGWTAYGYLDSQIPRKSQQRE